MGPATGRITLPCPSCARPIPLPGGDLPSRLACPACAGEIPLFGGPASGGEAPGRCPVCGSPALYWRKDLAQKVGCLFVLAGAALVPWTYGLSLAAVALLDLILYRVLPRVTVCYVCRAAWRGVPPGPEHAPYDLVTAQRFEARALSWADGRRRPAFAPGELSVDPPDGAV